MSGRKSSGAQTSTSFGSASINDQGISSSQSGSCWSLSPSINQSFINMSPEKTVLKKDQAEEERELLRLLLEKEGLGSQDWEITSPGDHERLPLSWAQKRLWFLDRLQPGSAFYNVVVVCELLG